MQEHKDARQASLGAPAVGERTASPVRQLPVDQPPAALPTAPTPEWHCPTWLAGGAPETGPRASTVGGTLAAPQRTRAIA